MESISLLYHYNYLDTTNSLRVNQDCTSVYVMQKDSLIPEVRHEDQTEDLDMDMDK